MEKLSGEEENDEWGLIVFGNQVFSMDESNLFLNVNE